MTLKYCIDLTVAKYCRSEGKKHIFNVYFLVFGKGKPLKE